ncbi:DNA endonuclease RBBP8, partial [Frankliniella fusca]
SSKCLCFEAVPDTGAVEELEEPVSRIKLSSDSGEKSPSSSSEENRSELVPDLGVEMIYFGIVLEQMTSGADHEQSHVTKCLSSSEPSDTGAEDLGDPASKTRLSSDSSGELLFSSSSEANRSGEEFWFGSNNETWNSALSMKPMGGSVNHKTLKTGKVQQLSLKDVLHQNEAIVPSVSSTASTLDFVSTASISNTTPTKSTPVLHDWQKANKLSTLISSYDRVPRNDEEPNYAYAHKPVRGLKRKGLPGHSCSKCDKYYKAANIDKGAIDKCSRHRSKYPRVPSPKGYWDLELPSSKWITALGSKPSPQKD